MTALIATRDWTPMMPVGVVSLTGALFVMRESVENIRKMWEFGRLKIGSTYLLKLVALIVKQSHERSQK